MITRFGTKTHLLAVVLMAAGIADASAQGFLAANNQNTTPLTVSDGFNSGVVGAVGALLGQGSVYVSLWVSTNGAPLSQLQQVAIGTNSTSASPLAAGTFNLGNPLVLPPPFDGTFKIQLLYRAWSVSLGTYWNQSWTTIIAYPLNGYIGESALLTNFSLSTGVWPPPPTFGPGLLQGIALGPGLVRTARSGNVVQWGDTTIPSNLTNVIAIAAGVQHRLALKADGTVIGWGTYPVNQPFWTNIPVTVPAGLSNVIAVASGWNHSLALRADGTIVAWGVNSGGQLNVPSGLSNVVAIAAGSAHSLALKADGTVVGWGNTNLPSDLTNVVAIAAGWGDLAVKADGTVVGWGQWYLHDPNLESLTGVTNAIAISSGTFGWMVLTADGRILDSGYWRNTDAVAISESWGYDFAVSLTLRANGTVVASGYDPYTGPMPVGLTNVIAIAAGGDNGMVLMGDGPPRMTASLSQLTPGSNGFNISLPTDSGRVYRLEYKGALTDSEWVGLPLVAGTGGVRVLTDPGVNSTQRFYRVRRW